LFKIKSGICSAICKTAILEISIKRRDSVFLIPDRVKQSHGDDACGGFTAHPRNELKRRKTAAFFSRVNAFFRQSNWFLNGSIYLKESRIS